MGSPELIPGGRAPDAEYDRCAVLRSLLPARVVVSVVVAFVFVGIVVTAGALFRDRDSPARARPPVAATVSPPRTSSSGQ
jgi:hypothetical protein